MAIDPVKYYNILESANQDFTVDTNSNDRVVLAAQISRGNPNIVNQSWIFIQVYGQTNQYYIRTDNGFYLNIDNNNVVIGSSNPTIWKVLPVIGASNYTIQHLASSLFIKSNGTILQLDTTATNYDITVSIDHP